MAKGAAFGPWPGKTPGGGTVTSVSTPDPVLSAAPTTGDVVLGQFVEASWDPAVFRVYAVDYDSGNDSAPGFATAASSSYADFQAAVAAAGVVAKKTMQGLGVIFPAVGAGRNVFVAIASRANGATYLKQDGVTPDTLDSFMSGRDGYKTICIWGTGTNVTAQAVKFTGSVNDLTYAGAIPVTGTNTPGYNPAAGATASTVPCLTVAGGAPGLAAEPAAPLGYSTRYDNSVGTATQAALRNVCRSTQIVSTTTTANDTVSPQANWPTAPVATDTFYLEEPGVACNGWGAAWGATNAQIIICGVRALTLTSYVTGPVSIGKIRHMFTGFGGGTSFGTSGTGILAISAIDPGVGSGTITRGSTVRVEGATLIQPGAAFAEMSSPVMAGNILLEFQPGGVWNIGAVFGAGVTVQGGTCGAFANNPVLGNAVSALQCRIIGPDAQAGLRVEGAIFNVKDTLITGSGAKPAIKVLGRSVLFIQGTSGTTGNTDVGLDLTGAQGSIIVVTSTTPTVTGTAGDVRLANGQIVSWAAIAQTGIIDSLGNCIVGSASPQHTVGKFAGISGSTSTATTTYFDDNSNGGSAAPLRYPTSLKLITRLRFAAPVGTGPNPPTATLIRYPGGTGAAVVTTMAVTLPASSPAGTNVEVAGVVLYNDGDAFDFKVTQPTASEGPGPYVGLLEGP